MRALVTGADGFIGRHMVHRLIGDGHIVATVDLEDGEGGVDVRDFFRKATMQYDLVVHAAAVVGGREMIDGSPLHVAAENLSLDADLFRWALRTRPGRIVYFSSSAAYPVRFQNDPSKYDLAYMSKLREDDIDDVIPEVPDQTYGFVKLVGERLAQEANDAGIKTHVFRPFSGYGEDQSLDYPFPSFIDRAARRADPFDIWGDGTQVRDWIHVDDIVGGVMAAIEQDVLGPVNLGTGIGTSMAELAGMIVAQNALRYPPGKYEMGLQFLTDKPTGVQYRVADPTLMHTFYTPKVSLEEGISRSLSTRQGTPRPAPR